MNVQEALLQERIDPSLTDARLTAMAERALDAIRLGAAPGATLGASSGAPASLHGPGDGASGTRRVSVQGYEILTGGCWNRVIGVSAGGRELVFKISPHYADSGIKREYAVLSAFAERSNLPVPTPLHLDAESEILPGTTLVMERLPGMVMHECFGMLKPQERRGIIDRIASDLSDLHTRRAQGFGGVELSESERTRAWPDFWLPRFDRVIDEAEESGNVPEALVRGAREVRPSLRPFLEIGSESTMTHYDVWSGNVMVDPYADPPAVSGYIDVPGFFADYARELSFAMLFGVANRRFFETYLQHHELDDGFALRANIYNLKMNIKHVEMYPGAAVYRQGAEENLEAIREAL
jgi:fructosamine-3-kinase